MRTALSCSILITVLTGLSLNLGVGPVLAQETTGQIEGRVIDAAGKPIAGADVLVSSRSLQGTRGASTDARGYFRILILPVGEYVARVTRTGYAGRVFEGVDVRLGQTTSLEEIKLEERAYEQPEVVVEEHAQLLDPTSTIIGGTLTTTDYETLPIERDYRNIATLLPEANQSYLGDPVNFAGATGLENRYFIDGIDVSDSFRGALGTGLPYNFIQEVQVRTGGYEAEYRSSLGGTMNVVTYSGGNEFTWRAFGFLTNNTLSATPRSVPGSPNTGDFARWDVGLSVGGAILRDRLWYYAAYNPATQTEDVEIPGFGLYEDHITTHSFAAKLTWRANDRNTLTLTGIGDPSQGRSVTPPLISPENVDPFLQRVRSGSIGSMLEGRHMISDDFFINSSVSWVRRTDESLPDTKRGSELQFVVDSTGVMSGGLFETRDNVTDVALVGLSCTWLTGDHELKAGIEYKDARLNVDRTIKNLTVFASNISVSGDTTPIYYETKDIAFQGELANRIPSVFLQDSWDVTDRLFLNVGLRWDGQFLVGSNGKVDQKILDQWQPRAGVAYELGRRGTQKLSASFGRYYQELMTSGPMWYYNENYHFWFTDYDHDPRLDPAGGDTWGWVGTTQPSNTDLEGQYFDEFTLGYERQIGVTAKAGVRGIYRTLRQGVEDSEDPNTGNFVWGNPGSGVLSAYPKMKRNYTALELTYQQRISEGASVLASYVLSRNYGNYPGLFDADYGNPFPNAGAGFDTPDGLVNSEGLLPNNRTHVFKLSGSYRLGAGVTVGAIGLWESGTPLNNFGTDPKLGNPFPIFLQKRGTAGQTPSIWDLNMRITYEPSMFIHNRWRPRFTADFLHIGSERKVVNYDQFHYNNVDAEGNQIDPNPTYGRAIAYQSPMAVRVGMEVDF